MISYRNCRKPYAVIKIEDQFASQTKESFKYRSSDHETLPLYKNYRGGLFKEDLLTKLEN